MVLFVLIQVARVPLVVFDVNDWDSSGARPPRLFALVLRGGVLCWLDVPCGYDGVLAVHVPRIFVSKGTSLHRLLTSAEGDVPR